MCFEKTTLPRNFYEKYNIYLSFTHAHLNKCSFNQYTLTPFFFFFFFFFFIIIKFFQSFTVLISVYTIVN